jgi:hypothetical protein
MTDDELKALIAALHNSTALGRLSFAEVKTVFAKLADLGYVLKPANVG